MFFLIHLQPELCAEFRAQLERGAGQNGLADWFARTASGRSIRMVSHHCAWMSNRIINEGAEKSG